MGMSPVGYEDFTRLFKIKKMSSFSHQFVVGCSMRFKRAIDPDVFAHQ
jgi:hypothetical protein